MATARYDVFKDKSGEWRWRVKAANGEILAQSEAYTRKEDAIRGIEALQNAVNDDASWFLTEE